MIIVKVREQKYPNKPSGLLVTIPNDKGVKVGDYVRILPIKDINMQDLGFL